MKINIASIGKSSGLTLYVFTLNKTNFLAATACPKAAKAIARLHPSAVQSSRPLLNQRFGHVAGVFFGLSGAPSRGGAARAAKLSAKQRRMIAMKANQARWGKRKAA